MGRAAGGAGISGSVSTADGRKTAGGTHASFTCSRIVLLRHPQAPPPHRRCPCLHRKTALAKSGKGWKSISRPLGIRSLRGERGGGVQLSRWDAKK